MESLRLPPTLGLRVVVAYEEKEGKGGGEETTSKEHMLSWDSEWHANWESESHA